MRRRERKALMIIENPEAWHSATTLPSTKPHGTKESANEQGRGQTALIPGITKTYQIYQFILFAQRAHYASRQILRSKKTKPSPRLGEGGMLNLKTKNKCFKDASNLHKKPGHVNKICQLKRSCITIRKRLHSSKTTLRCKTTLQIKYFKRQFLNKVFCITVISNSIAKMFVVFN